MRKVILLDTAFPYEKAEPFLETEIRYTSINNDVYIANCRLQNNQECRSHENVTLIPSPIVKTARDDVFSKIKWSICGVAQKSFWKEIGFLIKNKNLSASNILALLSFVSDGERSVASIRKYLKDFKKTDNFLFYSYWMHIHAYAAARLKKIFEGSVFITRCHRYDLYEYNYIPMRHFIFENVDRVFCISEDGQNYLHEKYPFLKNKTSISRLGTIDHGKGLQLSGKGCYVIVSCSWLVQVKRVDLIISALSCITDLPIKWVHFGGGELFTDIERKAHNLPKNIQPVLMGNVSNSYILDFYKNNDVRSFVNVSSSEGIPVSIMEAMSYGIPIIATDVGGVAEIVGQDNPLLLEKDFSIEELVDKIRWICSVEKSEYIDLRNDTRHKWEINCDAELLYKQFSEELNNF